MLRKKSDRNEFSKFVDMTAITLLILSMLVAFTQYAHAKAYTSSQDFAQKATIGGLFEVQSSQLALQRSQNDSVKAFAQHMIDDHTKADDQLATVLATSSVKPTDVTQTLDADHQKMLDKLNSDTDRNFDKDYIHSQKKAHKEAVDLFSDYAKSGDDDSLKTYAAQTLPTLKEHKQQLHNIKM
jgi:putative membrane protein